MTRLRPAIPVAALDRDKGCSIGKYLTDARHHVRKIEDFYDHAGALGYDQAVYHWHQLSDLAFRASQSQKYKGEAGLIVVLQQSIKPKMDEMEERKKKENP